MTSVKGQYQTLKLPENVLAIKAHERMGFLRRGPPRCSPDKGPHGTGGAHKYFRN